jgi:hypothetical protein
LIFGALGLLIGLGFLAVLACLFEEED